MCCRSQETLAQLFESVSSVARNCDIDLMLMFHVCMWLQAHTCVFRRRYDLTLSGTRAKGSGHQQHMCWCVALAATNRGRTSHDTPHRGECLCAGNMFPHYARQQHSSQQMIPQSLRIVCQLHYVAAASATHTHTCVLEATYQRQNKTNLPVSFHRFSLVFEVCSTHVFGGGSRSTECLSPMCRNAACCSQELGR